MEREKNESILLSLIIMKQGMLPFKGVVKSLTQWIFIMLLLVSTRSQSNVYAGIYIYESYLQLVGAWCWVGYFMYVKINSLIYGNRQECCLPHKNDSSKMTLLSFLKYCNILCEHVEVREQLAHVTSLQPPWESDLAVEPSRTQGDSSSQHSSHPW